MRLDSGYLTLTLGQSYSLVTQRKENTMRKIINSTYLSLDGVVEGPHLWQRLKAPSDARAETIQTDLLMSCDAVLMGRRTFEGFAPVWQTRSGDPYSDRINTMPKYVVSSTLQNPDWANTTVISQNVASELARLKNEPGQDIVQYGIGSVTKLLMENNLLDEFRIWLHPQTVGKGTPNDLLFGNATEAQLELTDTDTLSNGIVILTYKIMR
jgi:dihydrofolate reductase